MITVTPAFKPALSGPVDRSLLKVEAYLNSSWVDLTDFVESISGTQEEVSQLTQGANANTLSLTLINDDGRFSPKNTAGPYFGYLTPNVQVRVSSVVGSESVRLFTGWTSNWIPAAKARTCQVTAEDLFRILKRRKILDETIFNPSAPTTGYYHTWVLERALWLSGIRWDTVNTASDLAGLAWASTGQINPDGSTSTITVNKSAGTTRATYTKSGVAVAALDLVSLTMPCTPVTGQALDQLNQLAQVVDGKIWCDAQGQIIFRCRMYQNDTALSSVDTFTVDSLDDCTIQANFEDSKYNQICNSATVNSTPWAFNLDASGSPIEEEVPFKGDLFAKYYFAAGEQYPNYSSSSAADLWCNLPSNIKLFMTSTYPTSGNFTLTSVLQSDVTNRVNGIAFQAGYPVFEQTRVKVAFVNNGSSAQQIENLTLKAKLMRPIQSCTGVRQDLSSQALYDVRAKSITNSMIPNASGCEQLAAWLIADGKDPKEYVTVPLMYGAPWLELGDKITVSETITSTIPSAASYVIKRITWRWSLTAFVYTIEACTQSPLFSVSALPAKTSADAIYNVNQNGTQSSLLPPQVIDGTKAMVGINNLPAFSQLVSSSRKLSTGLSGTYTGLAYYGGFIWACTASGYITKIDPLNFSVIASYQPDSSGAFVGCAVYQNTLYVCDSNPLGHRVIWFDMSNPGTAQGINWGIKINLQALPSNGINPRFALIQGTKLYVHAKNGSLGSVRGILYRVDVSSQATVALAEISAATSGGYSDVVSNELTAANGYIWAVSAANTQGAALSSSVSAGASSVSVASATGLSVGQGVKVGSNATASGATDEYTYITAISGTTLTVSPAIRNAHTTSDKVFGVTTTIARFNPSTGTVDQQTITNDGVLGQGLECDGSRLWVSFTDKVVRYQLPAGVPSADKVLSVYGTSAGTVFFDGSFIWWVRSGSITQIDPRSAIQMAAFTTESTSGGFGCFDGRSIIVGGTGGSVYMVPRWTSQSI